jgi:hypothetical protein
VSLAVCIQSVFLPKRTLCCEKKKGPFPLFPKRTGFRGRRGAAG